MAERRSRCAATVFQGDRHATSIWMAGMTMHDLCSAGWDFEIEQWDLEASIIDDNVRTIGAIARDAGLLPDFKHPQFGTFLSLSAGEHILRALGVSRRDVLDCRFDELAALVDRFATMAA